VNAVLLAAGYGTRLYPITRDTPKPLLEVGGRTMADHLLQELKTVSEIDGVYIVTNEKFHDDFVEWVDPGNWPWPVTVVNDGTTQDGNRLGAIGDIKFTINEAEIEEDLLVLAGDNLFDFDLQDMVETFREKRANVIGTLVFEDESKLSKYGIVEVDDRGQVIDFVEKPDDPPSNLVSMAMYLFPAGRLHLIDQYLDEGGNPDEPGWYMSWLAENDELYAHRYQGNWFDIGDKDSLEQADEFLTEHSLR